MLDRQYLLASGLHQSLLPSHLALPNDEIKAEGEVIVNVLGQPDRRDCHTDMVQFYENYVPNGCKPLQLMQVIGAQKRTNEKSDEDISTFGGKVWATLDEATKYALRDLAGTQPIDK